MADKNYDSLFNRIKANYSRVKYAGKVAVTTGLAALATGCAAINDCVISQRDPYIIYGNGKWCPAWREKPCKTTGKLILHLGLGYGANALYDELTKDEDHGSATIISETQVSGSSRGPSQTATSSSSTPVTPPTPPVTPVIGGDGEEGAGAE